MILSLQRVAWRNLQRNKLRATLLILSVALMTATLFSAYYYLHSIERSLDAGASRMGADLIVVPEGLEGSVENLLLSGIPTEARMSANVVEQVAHTEGVSQVAPQLYLKTYSGECCNVYGDFPIIAVDPDLDFTIGAFLLEDRPLERGQVIIGSYIGSWDAYGMAYQPHWSESVRLLGEDFRIRHLLHRTNLGVDKSIFMTIDDARRLAESHPKVNVGAEEISVVMVKISPGFTHEEVALAIKANLAGVDVFMGNKLAYYVENQLGPIKMLLYGGAILVLLMTVIQVLAIFSAIVHERRREIGYMQAMGATKGRIIVLFLWEAFWASLLGSLIGLLAILVLWVDMRHVLQNLMPIPIKFPWYGDGIIVSVAVIVLAIFVTLSAMIAPVWWSMRRDPYQTVRDGE
ncbi:ABC transporter permease [Heliorestis acidaminivorans]|uniref:Putative hemin transport system permease protein HrtB n=1 Tax=Heliorestis acidaminivorans TaxID=553427 RepID=A0A6I0ETI7_9FIRM|nr:ABC transporter permease [Heliorestis acidaminivorans]KAB2953399.1 ABC transporter permease [Heliorestis acidaminivorans]